MRIGKILGDGSGGRDPRRQIRASRAQEASLAKDLKGGRVQVASGSRWDKQGDVIADEFVVEAKMTEKLSYRVTLDVWLQVVRQAIDQNKRPVLAVQIKKTKLAVIPWEDYLALLRREDDETS